jgi:twitching motility two-component system response regulator PilH
VKAVYPRRALIIDDEADVVAYLASVLSEHGWEVQTARSGDEGLELAHDQAPDVILLDLLMPGGRGGLDTFLELRKDPDLKSVPVVFVTAFHEDRSGGTFAKLSKHREFQPDAYLEKPVDPDDLISTLDEVTGTFN